MPISPLAASISNSITAAAESGVWVALTNNPAGAAKVANTAAADRAATRLAGPSPSQ